jgi:hypothetical protein
MRIGYGDEQCTGNLHALLVRCPPRGLATRERDSPADA